MGIVFCGDGQQNLRASLCPKNGRKGDAKKAAGDDAPTAPYYDCRFASHEANLLTYI